jgi:hypothetical protein
MIAPVTGDLLTRDEELRHAFDALAARLRETVGRHAQDAAAELVARVNQRRAEDTSETRLLGAFHAIDAATSLTGVLDAVVDAIAHDDARVVVLLRRAKRLRVWRIRGVDASLPIDAVEVTFADAQAIADAIHARTARRGTGDGPLSLTAEADREWIAAPIVIAAEAVAVLYADRRISDAEAVTWPGGIEMLVRHAAKALETLAAFKTAAAMADEEVRRPTAPRNAARQVS